MASSELRGNPPHIIGHYQVLDLIGEGGMGTVYRCRDLKLQREVALKQVRADRFPGPQARHRLMLEARAASRLAHPNIVRIFDVFEEGDSPWIVMELVKGRSLRERLRQQGPLPLDDTLRYAEELTAALAAAHAEHVLHRDLNPNNVLITHDGHALLADFGLACIYVPPGEESAASTLSPESIPSEGAVGTPGYIAPEQILGHGPDPRSDIFALGLVFYEMCTARPAFKATESGNITDAVLHREPAPISRWNREIPGEFERIIRKATTKQPEDRYQTAADMLADLRYLRRRIEGGTTSPALDVPRRRATPRRALAVLIAGGAIGAAVLAPWIIFGRLHTTPALPEAIPRLLTSGPGWESDPALSPDGTLVAYTSDEGGGSNIWIVDASGGAPLRLTDNTSGSGHPAWFPNGSTIAFDSDRGGRDAVYKVSRLGGPATLIVHDAAFPAISPDGRWIAFSRKNEAGRRRIAVTPLNDPSAAKILTGDGDGGWHHMHPAWSPDGTMLCYQASKGLWIVPARGGTARRLTKDDAEDEAPVWAPDGRYIYFSSNRDGARVLWRIAPAGGTPVRLNMGSGPEVDPTIGPGGHRLAFSTYVDNWDIILLDRATGVMTRVGGARNDIEPSLSSDADQLLFASDREGLAEQWLQPLAEGRPVGQPRKMFEGMPGVALPVFSPDGRWIAFARGSVERMNVWITPAAGGDPVQFTDGDSRDLQPAWSPDGRKIALASERDGQFHIWVAPVSDGRPAGPARRIASGPCLDRFPAWSPDGVRISFLRTCQDVYDIWVAPADGTGEARQVTHLGKYEHAVWDPVTGGLLVRAAWQPGRTEIYQMDADLRSARPLHPPLVCGSEFAYGTMSVSRDGRFIATMAEDVRGDIWLLEAPSGSF